jgi:hypothetical protein
MSCSASACLAALSRGHWSGSLWRWDDAPSCCQFGQVGPERAQRLLAGRKLVFVGDSQTRRHMWAIVDAVGGARVRRRHGFVVPDSHRAFDEAAIGLNDTIYDSQRAYHAGQTVLLNVRTGRWVLLDPKQLCGVDQTHWMTDHRLVGALERRHVGLHPRHHPPGRRPARVCAAAENCVAARGRCFALYPRRGL